MSLLFWYQPCACAIRSGSRLVLFAFLAFTLLLPASIRPATADEAPPLVSIPYPTDALKSIPFQTRGEGDEEKLSPDLRQLHEQFVSDSRNPSEFAFTAEQLDVMFGIAIDDPAPLVQVSVTLAEGADLDALSGSGIAVLCDYGELAIGVIPVAGLLRLARVEEVLRVEAMQRNRNPRPPAFAKVSLADKVLGMRGEGDIDRQGLTGRGVIVGVVDSGIHWSHGDFVDANGESRILYLWDMLDGTYGETDGAVGLQAPVGITRMGSDFELRYGTLYDRDMITAALKGEGTCNSRDVVGHGTACASVAAGNGMATAYSVPAGTYAGLAPEADLMVCRAGDGSFDNDYLVAVRWIAETAQSLGRPCVINLSLGSHGHAHDGGSPEEKVLDEIVRSTGAVVCVCASNEGRESFHTSGRFGPRAEGQMDVESSPVELFVTNPTQLCAFYHPDDDWGFAIVGMDDFITDEAGNPGIIYLHCVDDSYKMILSDNIAGQDFSEWFGKISFYDASANREIVTIPLLPGRYQVCAFGATWDVADGRFDFYLPLYSNASFGRGAVQTCMVGSPGNADEVITVGSYDFRNEWINWADKTTRYNLELGAISDYSSPGFRIDGAVKPDIAAPGRYAISAKVPGSVMAVSGGEAFATAHTTSDGLHLAWMGTSASTPYAAGVVALMLEKNPGLTPAEAKEILIRTATSDRQTGAVPNEWWGHGRLNPEAALRATPTP